MAATTPSTSSTQYETPARIKSDCIIQLRTSSIPSAVRGLFVVQDVKAGSIHLHPTGHPENGASRLANLYLAIPSTLRATFLLSLWTVRWAGNAEDLAQAILLH